MKEKILNKTRSRYDACKDLFSKSESLIELYELEVLEKFLYDQSHPVWVPLVIKGITTDYDINNMGEVRNKDETIIQTEKRKGYNVVHLHFDKIEELPEDRYQNRILVAETFIPNPDNKPEVNHMNKNKDIDWVWNLEWADNVEDEKKNISVEDGVWNIHRDDRNYTDDQIRVVCRLLTNPSYKIAAIAVQTGVPIKVINHIRFTDKWDYIVKDYNIHIPKITLHSKYQHLKSGIIDMLSEGNSVKGIRDKLDKLGILKNVDIKELMDEIYCIRENIF